MTDTDHANLRWQECERYCRRFEAAWHDGAAPVLEAFLPDPADSLRQAVLCELVHLDLEFRLKSNHSIRVEDYLRQYPQLNEHPDVVLELIQEEYALRRESEHDVSPAEYSTRFPPFAAELRRRLSTLRIPSISQPNRVRRESVPVVALPKLGGFEILELIGVGGMGVVYRARQTQLDRMVAVKMIRSGVGADAEERGRFLIETRAAAQLQHPNIVQIYEVGECDGQPYCVFEYVAGMSLHARLASKPMPIAQSAALLEVLARAVDYSHQRGIIHRDLKPANILLANSSDANVLVPKIVDFGLAKRIQTDSEMTVTGAIVGTVHYMAPEQAMGTEVGPAADIYALGSIFYEMLTGGPPFNGATHLDTLAMVRDEEPIAPARLNAKVSSDLETICLKCLEKDPTSRYLSAEALAEDLRRCLAGEPIIARPAGAADRLGRWCRRKPALAAALALALTACFSVIVISVLFAMTKIADADKLTKANTLLENEQKETKKALDEKITELAARLKAEAARRNEEKQRRRFHQLAAMLALERGLKLCEDNHARDGLNWLACGLQILPEDSADLEFVLRSNLAAWSSGLGEIRSIIELDQNLETARFCPDGVHLMTRTAQNRIKLWNLETGNSVGAGLFLSGLRHIIFSPNGKTFCVVDGNGASTLHDTASCKQVGLPFAGNGLRGSSTLRPAAIHPDSHTVLSSSLHHAQLWNAITGQPIGPALTHPDDARIVLATLSQDGKIATTVSWDNRGKSEVVVCRWDAATGLQTQPPIRLPHRQPGQDVLLSPDGRYLLTRMGAVRVICWDLQSGKLLHEKGTLIVRGMVFAPDSKHYYLTTADLLLTFESDTGKQVNPPFRQFPVGEVQFDPAGEFGLITSTEPEKRVLLADVQRMQTFMAPFAHTRILAESIGPDGRVRLAVRTSSTSLQVIDLGSTRQRIFPREDAQFASLGQGPGVTIKPLEDRLMGQLWHVERNETLGEPFSCVTNTVQFAGNRLLTQNHDGKLQLLDTVTGKHLAYYHPIKNRVNRGLLTPDGKFVVTFPGLKTLQIWKEDGITPACSPIVIEYLLVGLKLTPDGKAIIATTLKDARVYDIPNGTLLHPPIVAPDNPLTFAVASPDGDVIVTVSASVPCEIRAWNRETGTQRWGPVMLSSNVNSILFTRDSSAFATVNTTDGNTQLRHTATGKPLGPVVSVLHGNSAAISGDGLVAAIGGSQGVRLFHLPTGHSISPMLPTSFSSDVEMTRHLIQARDPNHLVRTWRYPTPMTGSVEEVVRSIQIATGLEMAADGKLRTLSPEEWRKLKKVRVEMDK